MKREFLWTIAIFAACALILTWPAALHLTDRIIGDPGDSYQFLGFQYLSHLEFRNGNIPFEYSNYWRYPYGVIVPNIVDATLFIYLGIFLYQIFTNPFLVYNISILILLFLNGLITYWAFRYRFSPLFAFLGAMMYGYSFFALSKLGGHFNLVMTAGFAGFLFSTLHFYHSHGSKRSLVFLGISTLLIAFASLQYPLIFIGSLPFILFPAYFLFKKEFIHMFQLAWQKKLEVAVTLFFVIVIFMLFHGTKLIDLFEGDVIYPTYDLVNVPFVNFFIPNEYLRTVSSFITNDTRNWIEYVVFAGYAELALLVIALLTLKFNRVVTFLAAATGLLFLMTAGTQEFLAPFWPYQYFFKIFPYRGIIEPGRFVVVMYLFSTILILLYLETIKNKRILYFIAFFIVLSRFPSGFYLNSTLAKPEFTEVIKNTRTRAVLDVPVRTDWWNGQFYDVYSIHYDKAITNAYFHWSGNTEEAQTLTKFLEPLHCYVEPEFAPPDNDTDQQISDFREELVRKMRFYDIKVLALHKEYSWNDVNCARARRYLNAIVSDTNTWALQFEDDQKAVYVLKND